MQDSFNNVYKKNDAGKWATKKRSNSLSANGASGKMMNGNAHLGNDKIPSPRKDRDGLKGIAGRAKKGGGGGCFTWGRPGDELNDNTTINRKDPNFDSEEEDDKVFFQSQDEQNERIAKRVGINTASLSANEGKSKFLMSPPRNNYSSKRIVPGTTLSEFKKTIVKITEEYFISSDVEEFILAVQELRSPLFHYEMVRRMVTLAMERNDRERELISTVIATMNERRILTIEQCGKGFERLFELVDDIVLDTPRCRTYIAQFLARCVADEVLPPSFLSDSVVEMLGGEVVEQAKILLSIKHGLSRLERVWGTGQASVETLKEEIKMILMEYLASSDLDEASVCVEKLHTPHFHHEIVKRAIVIALDKKERERAMMASLIAELYGREIASAKQIQFGFKRLYESLSDLILDTPDAEAILTIFTKQGVVDKYLTKEYVSQLEAIGEESKAQAKAKEERK